MKKLVLFSLVVIITLVILLVVRARTAKEYWYGHCKIGDDENLTTLIAFGQNVYVDQNADGVPQKRELIPKSGSIEIHSPDGNSVYKLRRVSVALVPSSVSENRPQLIDIQIQSDKFPDLWQIGTIVTARNPKHAGTCHLLGPYSIYLMPSDIQLPAGETTDLKIAIGTIQTGAIPISADTGPSGALVYTSVPGDRTQYAFDDSLRPKMRLSFGNQPNDSKTIVFFDGFC